MLCTLKAWEDPGLLPERARPRRAAGVDRPGKINPKGSSLAYGHPFAATGARILGLTAKLLATEMKQRALISVCTAGGRASRRSSSARRDLGG